MDYGYDDLYRLTRETIWKRDWTNDFAIARRIDYSYDKVGNRERMTVTHDDLNSNGPCVTESVTTYEYDANDRLTSSTTTVTRVSPVAQARFNDYYAGRPRGWTRWAVLAFASVSLAAFFAPLLMPYGRRLGRRARRRRIRTACVAAFFVPLMAVDPQTVDALTTEALRAQAAIAAGIPLDCDGLPMTTVTYGYDANGNQTTRTTQRDGNTTVETFIFDVENRLVGYRKSENGSQVHAASASYTYDADGVRTSKTTNSKTTLYTTDKNRPYAQVLEEREAKTGDLIVRYTYGDDLISQTRPQTGSADVTRYYHYDGQMSTRHLTNNNAIPTSVATTDRYTYDAFGNDLGNDGTTANAYRYTGEQFDEAVGQYYLRARYYDQGVGRFTGRDPFGGFQSDPMSLHKYAYCNADPSNNIDPQGLWGISLGDTGMAIAITGLLGGIVSGTIAAWTAPSGRKLAAWAEGAFKGLISGSLTAFFVLVTHFPPTWANGLASVIASLVADMLKMVFLNDGSKSTKELILEAALRAVGEFALAIGIGIVLGGLPFPGVQKLRDTFSAWTSDTRKAILKNVPPLPDFLHRGSSMLQLLKQANWDIAANNATYELMIGRLAALTSLDNALSGFVALWPIRIFRYFDKLNNLWTATAAGRQSQIDGALNGI